MRIVQTPGGEVVFSDPLLNQGDLNQYSKDPEVTALGRTMAKVIATTYLAIYADANTGDDATGDGSILYPFRTLKRALEAVPSVWQYKVRIYLSAGTFTIPTRLSAFFGLPTTVTEQVAPADDTFGAGRNIRIIGQFRAVDSGTITAITNTAGGLTYQITDAAKAWVASEHEGRICRITSGAGVGKAFRIRTSTATMLETLTPNVLPNPAIGDTFDIQEPATILQGGSLNFYGGIVGSISDMISMYAITWRPTVNVSQFSFNSVSASLNCCTIDFSAAATCSFSFGTCNGRLSGTDIVSDPDLNQLDQRCGVFFTGTGTVNWSNRSSGFNANYLMARNGVSVSVGYNSWVGFFAVDAKAINGFVVQSNSVLRFTSGAVTGFVQHRIDGTTNATGAIRAIEDSQFMASVTGISISNCAGSAIVADYNSNLILTGTIAGAGNAAFGISVQHFSKATINANVSVTGATNDCRAGATAGAYAPIIGGAALTEAKSQTAIIPNV